MTTYTTSELSRRSGDIIADALRSPVTITQRNKPRLILLNIDDYRRLLERGDTRKAGTMESMSGDLFDEVVQAFADYEREGGPE